jgi:uncharacterized BrkB/YihY/UPF0761 family membrane protein
MTIFLAALFGGILGALLPIVGELLIQYSKDPSAPEFLRTHPYRIPIIGVILVIAVIGALFVWALNHEKNKKNDELAETNVRIKKLEDKLNDNRRPDTNQFNSVL